MPAYEARPDYIDPQTQINRLLQSPNRRDREAGRAMLEQANQQAQMGQRADQFSAAHAQQLAEFLQRERQARQEFDLRRQDTAQRASETRTSKQQSEAARAEARHQGQINTALGLLERGVLTPEQQKLVTDTLFREANINPATVPVNERANVVGQFHQQQGTNVVPQQPTGTQQASTGRPAVAPTGAAGTPGGAQYPAVGQPGGPAVNTGGQQGYVGGTGTQPSAEGEGAPAPATGAYTEGGHIYNPTPEIQKAMASGQHYNVNTGEWRSGITPSALVEATPGASRVDPTTGYRTERLPSGGLASFADRSTAQGRSAIGTAAGNVPIPAPAVHEPVANRFVNVPGYGVGGGAAVPHAEAVPEAPLHPAMNLATGGPMTTPPGYTGGPAEAPGTSPWSPNQLAAEPKPPQTAPVAQAGAQVGAQGGAPTGTPPTQYPSGAMSSGTRSGEWLADQFKQLGHAVAAHVQMPPGHPYDTGTYQPPSGGQPQPTPEEQARQAALRNKPPNIQ